MNRRTKWISAGALAVAVLAVGSGIAVAAGTGDDSSEPIPAGAIDRASAVALDHTGGGTVTATEVADEEGYYEVEVELADGSQVDVHLDREFNVLEAKPDKPGDEHGPEDR